MSYPLIFPEAMACRSFCINIGSFVDGDFYVDQDLVIYVEPSVWEVAILGDSYSCHVRGEVYHFERSYSVVWEVEDVIPEEFEFFVAKAYEYDKLKYPKLQVITV